MPNDDARALTLTVRLDSPDELAALEQALLRARATELAEVRRHQVRLSAGYGDATTRDAMTGERAGQPAPRDARPAGERAGSVPPPATGR